MIWTVKSWNSHWHCTMYSNHDLMYFDRRVSAYISFFWRVVDLDAAISSWKSKSKHQGNVCLSGKSGQSMAPAWSENIASREPICAQVILKSMHFPVWCVTSHLFSTTCCLGKPDSTARDVISIARGNSVIIAGNASARTTAKPSTVKWFHLVPPKYYWTATEMENSAD